MSDTETKVEFHVQTNEAPSRHWYTFTRVETVERAREVLAWSLKNEPPKLNETFRIVRITTTREVVK